MGNWAYVFVRLGVGISLFGHGLVRMPKLLAFSCWMIQKFKDTPFPSFIITPYSYALPVAEFSIGLLLLLGVFTKQAAIAGSVTMLTLIFGTCILEDWGALPSQMIHILFLSILLSQIQYNTFSIDNKIKK